MKKLEMSKLVFDTAKSAFKKLYRKHKAEVSRTKKTKGAVPTVPYQLKKAEIKKKIRGTKFTAKADIKAKPGLRRRILLNMKDLKEIKRNMVHLLFMEKLMHLTKKVRQCRYLH